MTEASEEKAEGVTRRVMVVEDDEDTAELLVQQLERDNMTVDVARNGQEAILITGENPPDLIVMDLMMPKLDGFETTRYFKAKFRGRYVPILVLTAKGDAASRARGARYGCEEYLTKPYARKELLASVDALLDLGALENDLLRALRPPEAESQSVVVEGQEGEEGEQAAAEAAPTPDPAAEAAARAERASSLRVAVVGRRIEFAELLIAGGRPEVARVHLERAVELDPESERAQALLSKLSHES